MSDFSVFIIETNIAIDVPVRGPSYNIAIPFVTKTRSSAIADKPHVLVCKVVEVWQDYLSEYVDKKFTYICYRRLIRHKLIYYGSKNCVIYNS